jgi:hypothetical protein
MSWRGRRSAPSRWNEPPKHWGPRSPPRNRNKRGIQPKWLPSCTWERMVPEYRCAPRKSSVAPANKPMAPRKRARPNWLLSGLRNHATMKANSCAILDRSPTRQPLKAQLPGIPALSCQTSPSVYPSRQIAVASMKPRQAVLGDGAAWIWNSAAELFPQAIQILDRFHAKEHISDIGKLLFPDGIERKNWIQSRYDELDEGRLAALVKALHDSASKCKEALDCIRQIWNNRRRMRYRKSHLKGLCTSSGIVEAGCKVVVGTRIKHAGMHWTVKGANAIIALRCSKLSGRFEDFWESRADQAKAAA